MGLHGSRPAAGPATDLIRAWEQGDEQAHEALVRALYDELRGRARALLRRERPGHTLQPTALVHELFLRLSVAQGPWEDSAHFLASASMAMRHILIDHARRRLAARRVPPAGTMPEPTFDPTAHRAQRLADLDEALNELAALDPRQGRVVELRYFGGLSLEETAVALDVSIATVKREWALARAWLFRRLGR